MNPEGRYPEPGTIRAAAREAWEKRQRRRLSIAARIAASVPWWLVAVAAVFYALSSQHTAAVFELLVPGWGGVAPIGIEFGLLFVAFTRKRTRSRGQRVHWTIDALQVMLFAVSVLVNAAGSFNAVVSSVGLHGLPFDEIIRQFGVLPATQQVALPLVAMAAVVIPLGTVVAGEGLATLFLEPQDVGTLMDEEWAKHGGRIEYEALRDAAVAMGHPPKRAAVWAAGILQDYTVRPSVSARLSAPHTDRERTLPSLPAHATADNPRTSAAVAPGRPGGHVAPSAADEFVSAAQRVADYLDANPDAANLSVRKLADAAGVGKTVAADALRDYKARTVDDVSADTTPDTDG
jgi:hypothetical protein